MANGENLNGQLRGIVDELVCHGVSLAQATKEFERQFLLASLRRHEGNASRSARALGIHRNTLRNKVAALGIDNDDYQSRSRTRRGTARKSLD